MSPKPFRESSHLLMDGAALRERLSEDGYLFVRGLIRRADILNVRHRLLTIAANADWLDKNSPVIDGLMNPNFDSKSEDDQTRLTIAKMWCDEELHRLRTHPNALSLFERIFQQPVLTHPNFFLRRFFPNAAPTQSHQDHVHVGGGDFFTMWTPLGDCSVEQGVLSIAAKSHKEGVFKSAFAGMDIAHDFKDQWVAGPVHAGDALIFTNLTVHKSLPNQTHQIRLSLDARYQCATQPIANFSVSPPAWDSGCADWESVYTNWSSQHEQFYWKELNPRIVNFDRRYYEVDYPRAFKIAKGGDQSMRTLLLRLI